MKKTYEMKVNFNENNINNFNQRNEIYHKMIEDPLIPIEVESYLNVNTKNNLIFDITSIVFE